MPSDKRHIPTLEMSMRPTVNQLEPVTDFKIGLLVGYPCKGHVISPKNGTGLGNCMQCR